jgi:hypothetical protein
MNTAKLPSIVLTVLGILFTLVGLVQFSERMGSPGGPALHSVWSGTLFLSAAILFAAAGIAWAISDAGQNSKKNAGN